MLFPTFKKKIGVQKKIGGGGKNISGGGGGGVGQHIFFRRFILQDFMFSSRFMLFQTFKKTKIGVKKKFGGGGGC